MEELLVVLKPLFELYLGKLGPIVQIILFVGSTRIIIKPLMAFYEKYVNITKSTKDDAYPSKIKASKAYKLVIFIIDWLASLKL